MHILIVSFSKWNITFNVSYQQRVEAAFISDVELPMYGCIFGLNTGILLFPKNSCQKLFHMKNTCRKLGIVFVY